MYLFSHQFNTSLKTELVQNFFIQALYKQLNAEGNEFLTQRDNYGNITYYTPIEIDQKDHMLGLGALYKFSEKYIC